jgi:hypothetical protein
MKEGALIYNQTTLSTKNVQPLLIVDNLSFGRLNLFELNSFLATKSQEEVIKAIDSTEITQTYHDIVSDDFMGVSNSYNQMITTSLTYRCTGDHTIQEEEISVKKIRNIHFPSVNTKNPFYTKEN